MPDIPVPPEAVTAAADAIVQHSEFGSDDSPGAYARAALEAAAPLIAAAERDRITALVAAWTPPCGSPDCEAWSTRDQIAAMIGDSG